MIKVNFNQKKTESGHKTKGLAPTGTIDFTTQFSQVVEGLHRTLEDQSITKIIFNICLILVFPTGLKMYELREIGKLNVIKAKEQAIVDQKNQELATLKKELQEYAEISKTAGEFTNKRSFLRKISGNRLLVPRVMDAIKEKIPPDIWLNNVKIEIIKNQKEEKILSLEGHSVQEASIDTFINELYQILYPETVFEDRQDAKEGQSVTYIKFSLKGKLRLGD